MLRRWRRTTALFVLGAAVSPWLSAGVVALHMGRHAEGGRHEHHEDAATAVAVHGHPHEAGTPHHEHLLTLPAGVPLPARAALVPPWPAPLARMIEDATVAAVRLAPAVTAAGHDPPAGPHPVSILRI